MRQLAGRVVQLLRVSIPRQNREVPSAAEQNVRIRACLSADSSDHLIPIEEKRAELLLFYTCLPAVPEQEAGYPGPSVL